MDSFILISMVVLLAVGGYLDYKMPDQRQDYRPFPRETDDDRTIQGSEWNVGEWEHPKLGKRRGSNHQ